MHPKNCSSKDPQALARVVQSHGWYGIPNGGPGLNADAFPPQFSAAPSEQHVIPIQ